MIKANTKITSDMLGKLNIVVGDKEGINKFTTNLLCQDPFMATTGGSKCLLEMVQEHGKLIGEAENVKTIIVNNVDEIMTQEEYLDYAVELIKEFSTISIKLVFMIKNLDVLMGVPLINITMFTVGDKGQFMKFEA